MGLKSFIVILAIAAVPLCSQAQQRGDPDLPMPTKADARRVVKIIRADKAKVQKFCKLGVLNDQIEQADKHKDTKKVAELSEKAYDLAKTLPEYLALLMGLEQLSPSSVEFREISAVLEPLDKLCVKK